MAGEIYVDYNMPPTVPEIQVTTQDISILINITNPPAEPMVNSEIVENEIWRKIEGEDWQKIGVVGVNESFTDYLPHTTKQNIYFVRAIGNNGTSTDSTQVSQTISVDDFIFNYGQNFSNVIRLKYDPTIEKSLTPTVETKHFGRELPLAFFGKSREEKISESFATPNQSDIEALQDLIETNSVICYRDYRGRRFFGVVTGMKVSDEDQIFRISLDIERISYNEGL